MKVIVVEDEKHARENLESLLLEIDPQIEIQAKLESVKRTVEWLQNHQTDLIFLDIHLADALSFKIFEQVEVKTPVIFTTAYDQYYKALPKETIDYSHLKTLLQNNQKEYQKRFIVNRGHKIMSVKTDQIAYFEGEDRYVYLTKKDGSRYIIDYKLSELENLLDPKPFFRLNRSFIANYESIKNIASITKSRFKVDLDPTASRDIIVSSNNAKHFKAWLNQ